MTQIALGVLYIAKDTVDVCRPPDGATATFANPPKGHQRFIARIGGDGPWRIVFEPTRTTPHAA